MLRSRRREGETKGGMKEMNLKFWSRGKEERRVALEKLELAINMRRVDGRHDAIKEAFGEYMSVLCPVDKKKVGKGKL